MWDKLKKKLIKSNRIFTVGSDFFVVVVVRAEKKTKFTRIFNDALHTQTLAEHIFYFFVEWGYCRVYSVITLLFSRRSNFNFKFNFKFSITQFRKICIVNVCLCVATMFPFMLSFHFFFLGLFVSFYYYDSV